MNLCYLVKLPFYLVNPRCCLGGSDDGGKNIRRVGGGFDFFPHSIISSLEIQYFPMAHWHGGLLPLMKRDLGKGVHLLSRSQLFKR